MPPLRTLCLIALAMLAFAGNSLLCRLALRETGIDAVSFTTIRLVSGAAMLWCVVRLHRSPGSGSGSWLSAAALFAYAAAFSFAYESLSVATGALLLFGAVQATMIGHGLSTGERFSWRQLIGIGLACGGLVGLLLPGLTAPPLVGAVLMLGAGVAWGVYSLRGRDAGDPTRVTAGNFLRTVPMAVVLSVLLMNNAALDRAGVVYAVASGALASGAGYAIWYAALPALGSFHAATIQLSVPLIAALGGIVFLGEAMSTRIVLASVAILGGIGVVLIEHRKRPTS